MLVTISLYFYFKNVDGIFTVDEAIRNIIIYRKLYTNHQYSA